MSAHNPDRIKILLVEDNLVIRTGLEMLLQGVDDFEVVGSVNNGSEGTGAAGELKPDVILMDVGMPVMDGIEAARQIRAQDQDVKIIMLTSHKSEQDIFASLSAGANGYCLKEAAPERICTAIRSVYAGDLWLDAAIASKVLSVLPSPGAPGRAGSMRNVDGEDRIYGTLSEREMEVLQLLVQGLNNTEIADRLIIGRETVKTHVRHIMDKLAVDDRVQAAVKALRHGLI
jgi:DNA-binding NarL/FixJ family response regulator